MNVRMSTVNFRCNSTTTPNLPWHMNMTTPNFPKTQRSPRIYSPKDYPILWCRGSGRMVLFNRASRMLRTNRDNRNSNINGNKRSLNKSRDNCRGDNKTNSSNNKNRDNKGRRVNNQIYPTPPTKL